MSPLLLRGHPRHHRKSAGPFPRDTNVIRTVGSSCAQGCRRSSPMERS